MRRIILFLCLLVAASAATAAVNPFQLLMTDHRKIEQEMEELRMAPSNAVMTVFRRLDHDLRLHMLEEDRLLYPELKDHQETKQLTLQGEKDHFAVRDLLGQMAKEKGEGVRKRLPALKAAVAKHVADEEKDLFQKAAAILGPTKVEVLGKALLKDKQKNEATAK